MKLLVCIGVYIIFFFSFFPGGQLVGRKPFLAACHTLHSSLIWWLLMLRCGFKAFNKFLSTVNKVVYIKETERFRPQLAQKIIIIAYSLFI